MIESEQLNDVTFTMVRFAAFQEALACNEINESMVINTNS